MEDHTGRYTVTYNDEIYNYLSLKKEMESKGHEFKSNSDTELLQTLLQYADRNSMAFSIENRVPYLDLEVMEFAYSNIHDHFKNGITKYYLRKAIAPFTPDEITWGKDKVGYEAPKNRLIPEFNPILKRNCNPMT